jgi:hypothetical protein
MGSGLRANSVFASFGVTTSEWSKGLGKIVQDTQKTLKQVEGMGKKFGGLGLAWGVALGGAVKVASEHNPALKASLDELKASFTSIALEVGTALLPYVQQLSGAVQGVTTWIQSLNPEVKAAAAEFAAKGAAVLLLAGALGKLAGIGGAALGGLSMAAKAATAAFRGLAMMVGGLSLPIVAVIAVVAGLALAAGALYKYYKENTDKVKAAFASVVAKLEEWGSDIGEWFSSVWAGVKGFIVSGITFVLDKVAAVARDLAKVLLPVAHLIPEALGGSKITAALERMKTITGADLAAGINTAGEKFFAFAKKTGAIVADAAESTIRAVGAALGYSFDGIEMLVKDLKERLGGMMPDLFGGEAATSVTPRGKTKATKKADEKPEKKITAAVDRIAQAFDQAKNKLLGRAGPVQGLIDSFQMGVTAGGGDPMAGIAMLVADLLSQSSQFGSAIEMVTGFVGHVADMLGQVLAPVLPVLGVAFDIAATVLQSVLMPGIRSLVPVIESITPLLWTVSTVLAALSPLIELFMGAVVALSQPLLAFAGPVMRGLFDVLRTVGMAVLFIAKGISWVWNGIVGAVQAVFRALGRLEVFGEKPLAFLGGWADGLESVKLSTAALDDAIIDLYEATFESAQAAAVESAERWKNIDAMKEATEALTNVPSGFKVAALRFGASDPSGGGLSTGALSGAVQRGSTSIVSNVTIQVTEAVNAQELALEIRAIESDRVLRFTGSRYA